MKTKWDLSYLFSSTEDWEAALEELKNKLKIWKNINESGFTSEEDFGVSLKLKIEIDSMIEKIYCYPRRFLDLNSLDEEHSKMFQEAWNLYLKIVDASKVFDKMRQENSLLVSKFLELEPYYKRYIEILDENIGDTLNEKVKDVREIYQTLVEKDLSFGTCHDEEGNEIKLTRKNFNTLMMSEVESVRKEVLETRNLAYQNINHTLALLLNKKYIAEIKKVEDSEMSLLEKITSRLKLPSDIVTNLIKTANLNIDVSLRYTELKKKILGKSELHIYDTALPLGLISKKEYELEDAIKLIKEALFILGDDYISKLSLAFQEGWVDVYPDKNKRKMSFSCISYYGLPYASLNYNKSLISVRTLAHELGHSIHTSYAKENPFEYFEYSLFLSEVVSKVNEILFNEYILSKENDMEERIYLLNNIVASLGNTLFGQTMLSEFEHTVIEKLESGKVLNADSVNKIYQSIFLKYHKDSILCDVDNSCDWSLISHFYMNDAYYLYQYAIGVSLAIDIVTKLKQNREEFLPKYIEFLKIGNRMNIKDSLSTLGICVEDYQYLETAFHYLNEKIDELQDVCELKLKKN